MVTEYQVRRGIRWTVACGAAASPEFPITVPKATREEALSSIALPLDRSQFTYNVGRMATPWYVATTRVLTPYVRFPRNCTDKVPRVCMNLEYVIPNGMYVRSYEHTFEPLRLQGAQPEALSACVSTYVVSPWDPKKLTKRLL